jgi:hypothetical protein
VSNANRMGPRPERKPTGSEGSGKIILPTQEEVERSLLDTAVNPAKAGSIQELQAMNLTQKIQEISQRKAGLLAELEEIIEDELKEKIDHETFLQRLDSFFIRLESFFIEKIPEINNLVSEINSNQQILGLEAAEEFIEEIQNSLYLDPKKDRNLINKLRSLLEKRSLKNRHVHFQLALLLDGGNKLEEFKRRVQAALELNDDKEQLEDLVKELEDLVLEMSALKIMQVYPISSSPVPQEKEAYELQAEYRRMIEKVREKLRPST